MNESKKWLKARRAEAAVVKKEAKAERQQIRNAERESKLADRQVRREIRKEKGGAGMTVTFYNLDVGGRKYKVRRGKHGRKAV